MKKYKSQIMVFLFSANVAASAADLTLGKNTGNPSLDKTRNGIPLVNIAKPNGGGISHNKFTNYNVGKEGLILNNATKITNTKLGGMVQGNANLGKNPAKLILNEVTSTNKSTLKGYTEVAGHKADVVVANPNGITCDGCGFINTPNATLTTGKPSVSGDTVNLSVTGGHVGIEGAGLNAQNIDKLSIISKAADLNAAIYAKNLDVITGSNDVNMKTGEITSKGASGSGVSIDSSALGGMYADRIRLIGTDKGVGVNLNGQVAAGAGGFSLTADGKIVINGVQSKQAIQVQSKSNAVTLNKKTYAKTTAKVQAKTKVSNTGTASAGGKVEVKAADIENSGTLVSGLDEEGKSNAAGELVLEAGNSIKNTGTIGSSNTAKITAKTVANQAGSLQSTGVLTVGAEKVINTGDILSEDKVAITATGQVNNDAGLIQGDELRVTAGNNISNQSGQILSSGILTLDTKEAIANNDGEIIANKAVTITAQQDIDSTKGTIHSDEGLSVSSETGKIINDEGLLSSFKQTIITGYTKVSNVLGSILGDEGVEVTTQTENINNQGGTILAGTDSQSANADVHANTDINNEEGSILATGKLEVNSKTAGINNHSGEVSGFAQATVDTQTDIDNTSGKISANNLTITSQGTVINHDGEVLSGATGNVTVNSLSNTGKIHGFGNLTVTTTAGGLSNQTGKEIISNGELTLNVAGNIANKGDISSQGDIETTAVNLTNADGAVISAGRNNTLTLSGDVTNNGRISSEQDLNITSINLTNNGGIGAGRDLTLTNTNLTNNETIFSNGNMYLYSSGLLHNSEGSNILSNGSLTIAKNAAGDKTTKVLNDHANIESGGDLSVYSKQLENIGHTDINYELYYQNILTGETSSTADDLLTLSLGYHSGDHKGGWSKPRNLWISEVRRRIKQYAPQYYEENKDYIESLIIKGADSDAGNAIPLVKALLDDQSETYAAQIIGGGNINLYVDDVLNKDSTIYSGKDLLLFGNLINKYESEEVTGNNYKHNFWAYHYSHKKTGRSRKYGYHGRPHGNPNIATQTSMEAKGNAVFAANDSLTINGSTVSNKGSASVNPTDTNISLELAGATNPLATAPVPESGNSGTSVLSKNFTLPSNQYGLYVANTNPDHPYLVESNPDYTSYNSFISSSYMIDRLHLDGDADIKRLGDSIYENKLIRDQIFSQTGKRYVGGYASDYEQYKYLMDNALLSQKDLGLVYGVKLTQSQIDSLTQDIVWMETEVIQGHKVLVPKVYLANLNNNNYSLRGGYITANNIDIAVDNISNSGNITASNNLLLASTGDIRNIAGNINAGNELGITTGRDIENVSGRIKGNKVTISAGRDFINRTATNEVSVKYGTSGTGVETTVGQQGSIESNTDLALNSGRDIHISGAKVKAQGDVKLGAGNDVVIDTVETKNERKIALGGGGYHRGSSVKNIRSEIEGNNIRVDAENDLNMSGAHLKATEGISLAAKNDISIKAAKDRDEYTTKMVNKQSLGAGNEKTITKDHENVLGTVIESGKDILINAWTYITSDGEEKIVTKDSGKVSIAGSTISAEGDAVVYGQEGVDITTQTYTDFEREEMKKRGTFGLSKSRNVDMERAQQETGSLISTGGKATVISDEDLNIEGSAVVATEDTTLLAKGDINLGTAEEIHEELHLKEESKIGFSTTNTSISFGKSEKEDKATQRRVNRRGSTVGSIGGNVNIIADGDVNSKATDIIAAGNISVIGQDVNLEAAANDYTNTREHKESFAGITGSLGGGAGQAVNDLSAADNYAKASNGQDSRTKELYRLAAARKAYDGVKNANEIASVAKDPGSAQISLSIGASKSESKSRNDSKVHYGGSIDAGGDISVIATGDKDKGKGNINIVGLSDVTRTDEEGNETVTSGIQGENIRLLANNELNIKSSIDTEKNRSNNSSKGGSVGVSLGQGTGITVSGHLGKGHANADSTISNDTTITANNTLVIHSGGDTNIEGGQLKGKRVEADIRGDLNIASIQDTAKTDAKQTNASGSITIGTGVSGNASYNNSEGDADYASVNKQSGIIAGEEGYNVTVGGNTDLKGGVIASTAEDQADKTFTTGTLTYSDIKNESSYEVQTEGISIGSNAPPMISPEQEDSGSAQSMTKAVVDGNITINNQENQTQDLALLSNTLEGSHESLAQNPDIEEIMADQQATQAAQLAAGEAAAKTVGDIATAIQDKADREVTYAKLQLEKAKQEGNQEEVAKWEATLAEAQSTSDNWKEGGAARKTLHVITQAYIGDASGAAGQAAAGVLGAEFLADKAEAHARANGVTDPDEIKQIRGAASSLGGLIAGGSAGAHAGATVEAHNRQLHQAEKEFIKKNIDKIREDAIVLGLPLDGVTDEELLVMANQGALMLVDDTANFSVTLMNASDGTQTFLLSQLGEVIKDLSEKKPSAFIHQDNYTMREYFVATDEERADRMMFLVEGLANPASINYNPTEFLKLMNQYSVEYGGLPVPKDSFDNAIMFDNNPDVFLEYRRLSVEFKNKVDNGIREVTGVGHIKGGTSKK